MGCTCHLMKGEICSTCLLEILELDNETPDEEGVVIFDTHHGRRPYPRTPPSDPLWQGFDTGPAADPDGPPSGAFLNQVSLDMNAKAVKGMQRRLARAASMAYINQPAKSYRDELRMGVNYEDRSE